MSWRCHGADNAQLIANLRKHGILSSAAAAEAMTKIDRAVFVPAGGAPYQDAPQYIGHDATISAPHMHAYCISMLDNHLKPGMSVLDVGSGSGYLSAVFALMVGSTGKVVGVERVPQLVDWSIKCIKKTPAAALLEQGALSIHAADGKLGFPDAAPYDAIHVGAAAPELPNALVGQLKPGGRMVIPVGKFFQDLIVIDKREDGTVEQHSAMSVNYVPLV